MTPQEFADAADVSRETLARLSAYATQLETWQDAVNLVGRRTIGDLWRRHMLDSAQLFRLLPSPRCRLIDLGSGAGFPGLVLAIMGVADVELIEANARKCTFLTEVARITETPVVIHNERIEALRLSGNADVITARALAPLPRLLNYAEQLIGPNTTCLFLKGRRLHEELTEAKKTWKMGITTIPSASDAEGTILCLKTLARNHDAVDADRV